MANREFTRRDNTFGLVTDVEQNLVAVDLYNDALDEVAVVEELKGCFYRCQEFFGGADVVDCDLLDGLCGVSGDRDDYSSMGFIQVAQ